MSSYVSSPGKVLPSSCLRIVTLVAVVRRSRKGAASGSSIELLRSLQLTLKESSGGALPAAAPARVASAQVHLRADRWESSSGKQLGKAARESSSQSELFFATFARRANRFEPSEPSEPSVAGELRGLLLQCRQRSLNLPVARPLQQAGCLFHPITASVRRTPKH